MLFRASRVIVVTISPNALMVPVQASLNEFFVQSALQRPQVHGMVPVIALNQLSNPRTASIKFIRVRYGVLVDPGHDGFILAAYLRLIRLSIS